jgi:WD40 repeat protein
MGNLAVSPDGKHFAAGSTSGSPILLFGEDGEEPLNLAERDGLKGGTGGLAFSLDGRFLAGGDNGYDPSNIAIHVWEVATRKRVAILRLDGEEHVEGPHTFFTLDGQLLTRSTKGVLAWDIETGEHEVLIEAEVQRFAASRDGRRLLVTEAGEGDGMQAPSGSPFFVDLQSGEVTTLATHGLDVRQMALDRDGGVAVTADSKGTIRVGTVSGEEPHLLLGHEDQVLQVALDPLGRWIASVSTDGTLRIWPMPDLSKPPLHTLPREELIAKLKTLTNLRVVRDPESATGWKLTHDPFPGWEEVPTW